MKKTIRIQRTPDNALVSIQYSDRNWKTTLHGKVVPNNAKGKQRLWNYANKISGEGEAINE